MSYLDLLQAAKSRQRAEGLTSLTSLTSPDSAVPLPWDDDRERERLQRTSAWADVIWRRGAWDWCREHRPDFYARLDATLEDIDAAFREQDTRASVHACEALRLVVGDIVDAYQAHLAGLETVST